jgi:hypothetical protein
MVIKSSTLSRALLLLATSTAALAQNNPAPGQPPPPSSGGAGTGIYMYPKNGQTQEQQWTDRYACHNWSKTQSGFDPTQQGGAPQPNEAASRLADYQRAMRACLEARGYSVSIPPVVPVPVPRAVPAPPPVMASTRNSELKYHPFLVQIGGGYTITQGMLSQTLQDGGHAALGFAWFPSSALPLGIRIDGS